MSLSTFGCWNFVCIVSLWQTSVINVPAAQLLERCFVFLQDENPIFYFQSLKSPGDIRINKRIKNKFMITSIVSNSQSSQ